MKRHHVKIINAKIYTSFIIFMRKVFPGHSGLTIWIRIVLLVYSDAHYTGEGLRISRSNSLRTQL